MENFISVISNTDGSSFATEGDRLKALEEARALVSRLETPWERIYKHCWVEPVQTLSMKTAADLDIFGRLSDTPQSSTDLGQKVNADPAFLRRILRVLVKTNVITEVGVDTYVHTDYSKSLADPNGLVSGIHVLYDASIAHEARMPEYFKVHGYQEPKDHVHAPFKWIEGISDFEGDRWDYLKMQPERYHRFNTFLSAIRQNAKPWTELYPPNRILDGWDHKSPLLVDVGGGYGRDASNFANTLGTDAQSARIVLQDRAEVIDVVKEHEAFAKNVEPMAHHFFKPNPVQGARAYFLHSVLHDWPDAPAIEILKAVKSAMKPGYSRVLLMEQVLPERASEWPLSTTALDINMMCNFAA